MDLMFSEIYTTKNKVLSFEMDKTLVDIIPDQNEIIINKIPEPGSVVGLVETEKLVLTIPEDIIKNVRKIKITKLKVICFDMIGKDPLSNYSDLRERDKKKFLELLTKYDNDLSIEEIDTMFNEICIDTIFDYKKVDYSSLPIYDA